MTLHTVRALRLLAIATVIGCTPMIAAAADSTRVLMVPAGQSTTIRLPGAAIVHHFAGDLVDANGRPIAGPVDWTVTVGSGRFSAIIHLTSARAALNVPRPFGYRLDQGDSLVVSAKVAGHADARVRIRVGYEIGEAATSRIAVRAVSAQADQRDADEVAAESPALTWVWTADAPGRLVAINAPQLAGAAAIVLEDAVTGEVIWRVNGPSRFASRATQLRDTQLPGIAIVSGRAYRLRVERGVGESTAIVAPIIMLVPRVSQAR